MLPVFQSVVLPFSAASRWSPSTRSAKKRFGEDFGIVPLDMDEKPLWFWESVLYRNSEELTSSARRLIRFCAEYARSQLAEYPEFFKGPASFDPYLSQL